MNNYNNTDGNIIVETVDGENLLTDADVIQNFSSDEENENSENTFIEDYSDDGSSSSNPNSTDSEYEYSNKDFYIEEISDKLFNRMYGKSYKEDCTIAREDLRYLHVLHKDLNGAIHEGELVVNAYVAEDVLNVFAKLYEAGYPIEKIRLVDDYEAIDELSMSDNNSSAFNFRFISGTTTISNHGLGVAVDINPLYNPYIRYKNDTVIVEPANGVAYTDRSLDFPYKIEKGDLAYELFTEIGFEWGGEWKNTKDYQHFELKSDLIKNMP